MERRVQALELVGTAILWLVTARFLPDILAKTLPTVVLGSLTLPAFNMLCQLLTTLVGGLLLARQIKANPRHRDVVIVASSVVDGHHVTRMTQEAGCVGYIRKPIDTNTFTDTLARCLQQD